MVTRLSLFYGWIIVLAAIVGRVMTCPGQTYGVSAYVEHFVTDLRISRSMVSTLYSVGTLAPRCHFPLWVAR